MAIVFSSSLAHCLKLSLTFSKLSAYSLNKILYQIIPLNFSGNHFLFYNILTEILRNVDTLLLVNVCSSPKKFGCFEKFNFLATVSTLTIKNTSVVKLFHTKSNII